MQLIVDGYPQIVDGWAGAAADMAAVWFEESVPGVVAVTADPAPAGVLESLARWAIYGGKLADALGRLLRSSQRSVYDGARDTTVLNAEKAGTRWARDAEPDACAFCRMLATRTARLYTSRDTAATKVHDDCHCVPIEVPDPSAYQLSEHAQNWQDEYRKAIAEAGITASSKQVLSAWRELSGIH